MYYETKQITATQWAVVNASNMAVQSVWDNAKLAMQVCKDLNRSMERSN